MKLWTYESDTLHDLKKIILEMMNFLLEKFILGDVLENNLEKNVFHVKCLEEKCPLQNNVPSLKKLVKL